ncbi:MAG TPA: hypothetical protein VMC84_04070 [Methanocella sp.]|uniref:hypothetical protein n=1 Tax=Methanocella sp. TaxID=2052833 RepID=UPI002B836DCE|nr:hypothetical protein [Methanocella sp.]HTY90331.1 hypothetical protein [Methanocella sp.]
MDHRKTLILILLIAALALAGCVSSSGSNSATTQPKVVATIGDPTPVPTEPPEPTVGPTWTPTPTPVPPALTLSDFNLQVKINGDAKEWTQDPSQAQPVNAQYAARQDTATFTVTNTGNATLKNLVIVYDVATPMTTIVNGQEFSTMTHQSKNASLDTLNPGDYRDVTIESPIYGAMLTANLTITANWNGGSLDLYMATLEPNFASGTSYTPANDISLKEYGSAS